MDAITALDKFAARARSLPDADGFYSVPPRSGIGSIVWRYAATAAVELSGMLGDCRNDDDLDEALAHFQSLFAGGVISPETWHETMMEVVAAARQRENGSPDCHTTRS